MQVVRIKASAFAGTFVFLGVYFGEPSLGRFGPFSCILRVMSIGWQLRSLC
jgi:hypothetical protein